MRRDVLLRLGLSHLHADEGNQVRVLGQVHQLSREGYTVIQSTHNPDQAFLYADDALAIMDGQVEAFGPPNEIMSAELIQRLYRIDVEVESLRNGDVRVCIPKAALHRKTAG